MGMEGSADRVAEPSSPDEGSSAGTWSQTREAPPRWFDRGSREERLPSRVQRTIGRAQDASEILIGWSQLGVVAVFAGLYALSPKTFSGDTTFAPVPWALGAYFLFTFVRLALAHHVRLADWFLYLSVVVDMGLLLGLIWTFHLQYEQPPSFYLKAPSLLYVFIFIALRALRFQVRFVLWAGVVAASGWLALAWYAIDADPTMITRDYVHYMTSNSILLGAEFDKIISILIVTVILSIAIARARGLLVQSVVEGSTVRDLSRFVPTGVAHHIARAEEVSAGQGEVREATILFTDIEGFTALSERLTPNQIIAVLNQYFSVVSVPIERHGGVINQFQGDAILATFNVPLLLRDHAACAVQAAVEMQALLHERTFGDGIVLRSRIGINSGRVLGGLVGTEDRLVYTVHGDDVNLAQRLETLNKEHGTGIIVSQRTCELAGQERFAFHPLGAVSVRGRQAAVTIYTVATGSSER